MFLLSFLVSPSQEIYPPKVREFAYVTDGACSVAEILQIELVVCKVTTDHTSCFVAKSAGIVMGLND